MSKVDWQGRKFGELTMEEKRIVYMEACEKLEVELRRKEIARLLDKMANYEDDKEEA